MKKINFLLSVLTIFSLVSCGNNTNSSNNNDSSNIETTITDSFERTVKIKSEVNRVVCIGAGALRLYSYIGDMNKLVAVEEVEKKDTKVGANLSFRPYKMVNLDLFDSLPTCGVGGPQSQVAEAEKILENNPDVIFSLISDVDAMNTLQEQTGIPVVMLSYGKTRGFDETIKNTFTIMGKVLNKEERVNELNSYIDSIISDLDKTVIKEPVSRVYLGCNSFYGTLGIESSSANFAMFNASHVHNILDEEDFKTIGGNASSVDLEYLISSKGQPDKIILDFGGLNILKNNYGDNEKATIYNSLNAFKNEEVYVQMPYNAYFTNIELAYCNAYFARSVAHDYPMNETITKVREILTKFLGKDCYDEISSITNGGYRKLNLASEFTNYSK